MRCLKTAVKGFLYFTLEQFQAYKTPLKDDPDLSYASAVYSGYYCKKKNTCAWMRQNPRHHVVLFIVFVWCTEKNVVVYPEI